MKIIEDSYQISATFDIMLAILQNWPKTERPKRIADILVYCGKIRAIVRNKQKSKFIL